MVRDNTSQRLGRRLRSMRELAGADMAAAGLSLSMTIGFGNARSGDSYGVERR